MLQIHLENAAERRALVHKQGPLEFGRASAAGGVARCVVNDPCVSRDHVRLEELPSGRLAITNLSKRLGIHVSSSARGPGSGGDGRGMSTGILDLIPPGQSAEHPLPLKLTFGETSITISGYNETARVDAGVLFDSGRSKMQDTGRLATIEQPFHIVFDEQSDQQHVVPLREAVSPTEMIRWFETVIAVQQAAATSEEFFDRTARALVDLVGLDHGQVLRRRVTEAGDEWEVVARYGRPQAPGMPPFSRTIVDAVTAQKRTFYETLEGGDAAQSLMAVDAVVAAPILDSDNEVIGIVYGARSCSLGSAAAPLTELEAHVVQMLAASVATGLSRQHQEAAKHAAQERFKRFFSAELAQELEANPQMLEGTEREVTVLFLDIRRFSILAERLGPRNLYELAEDFMDQITLRIQEGGGVVVDYVGDGVLAMWNAPADQPDHPALACTTALAICDDLPALNHKWAQLLGIDVRVGIGINTGLSLVGNAGSRQRLKYGPRGHAVNLGSRVEGATKYLGVPILVSGFTHDRLNGQFATRRLCRVQLAGMNEVVDLYEVYGRQAPPEWLHLKDTYESALADYERGQWDSAVRTLLAILNAPPAPGESGPAAVADRPTLELLERSIRCLKNPPLDFDPVWQFGGK